MIESGKRVPSDEVLGLFSTLFQREPRWFLDGNAEIAPRGERRARRRRGRRAARAGVSLLEGAPAGGDPGAARADRHHRAAVRAPADPLAPGDVAQRLPGPRARGRGGGRAPLPARGRGPAAPCPRPRAHGALVRPQARARARQGPGAAQHDALVLRGAAHHLPQPRAAVGPGAAQVRPRLAHRPQGAARGRRVEVARTPPAARWAAAPKAARPSPPA